MAAAQETQQPFSLVIEAAKNPVTAGEDVIVKATLTNSSKAPIRIWSYGLSSYRIELRDAAGNVLTKPDPRHRISAGKAFDRELAPGEAMVEDLNVSVVADMSPAGRYTIRLVRPVPDDLGKGVVISNRIVVVVGSPK
jgi:hypothetical protein